MTYPIDYQVIIRKAWEGYDASRMIVAIEDISVNVSTNRVCRITLDDDSIVIAKLSSFGKFEHFREDHRIIHALANNLLYPFENLLTKSLLKNNRVYVYRYKRKEQEFWVVFYNPTRVMQRLPRRLEEPQIRSLGKQMAKFHKACSRIRNVLPKSSKTLRMDITTLLDRLEAGALKLNSAKREELVKQQCQTFLRNRTKYNGGTFELIPVFIDWNIGNFSVINKIELYSRWDYDWFRMSSRTLDFYFLSRVVSDVGDRTVFSYVADTLMEDRFLLFLAEYHKVYPLLPNEIRFIAEAYRFFILNYVIKDGNYFFEEPYARKLRSEAIELYLPSIEDVFDADKIIRHLKIKETV